MNEYYHKNKDKIISRVTSRRFGDMRESAILRDKEKCVKCGFTRKQHLDKYNRDITVDHIDGNGRNSKNPNNDIDNLQTLCLKCHGLKDQSRVDYTKRNLDDKWKAAVSKTWFKKGRIVPSEIVELNRKRMLENNPFKGKKHTDETKRIMSEKAKARWAKAN